MLVTDFKNRVESIEGKFSRRIKLKVLQVNMGNMCNQRCSHCHVNASPEGDKVMSKAVAGDVISFLSKTKGLVLDVTGGCPELTPHFRYLIKHAKRYAKKIMVRSNLTILFEQGMADLSQFYQDNRIKLVCSMPCYTQDNVDQQRGDGVFDKSIQALKKLNSLGYGKDKELELDLVYNPGGAFLPGNQEALECDYKKVLNQEHGIVFNRLLTITNAPINRFQQYLKANGQYDAYMQLLISNFNSDVVEDIMCRNLLSVAWNGIVYDCDFNQALGISLRDKSGNIMEIRKLKPKDLVDKGIIFADHCFCCTAGAGSSCSGALEERS